MNDSGNPKLVSKWNATKDHAEAVQIVTEAIVSANGDVSAAAETLKINRRSLHRWIRNEPKLLKINRSIRRRKGK